jgi:hypothetical protein
MKNNIQFSIFSIMTLLKKHVIPSLLCFNMLVFLETDSLVFQTENTVIEKWHVGEQTERTSAGTKRTTTHAVVAQDSTRFLYFKEIYLPETDSMFSQLTLYRADRDQIWQRTAPAGRTFARFLTGFVDDRIAVVITNQYGAAPSLELITSTKIDTIIREGDWYRLTAFAFSPNRRFIIMHVKNPYREKVWDYIHFIDLATDSTWSYLFPICVTCKRYKHIDVSVDDDGISEVVYKGEHRMFSKDGILIDVFIKF